MMPDANLEEIIQKTSEIDLDDMHLSLRFYNYLKRGGYKILTDVMTEVPDKFLKIRNFGKNCE